MNPGEPRQRVSNGLLADGEVIVAWPLLLLMRANTGAHTQPQAREAEERGQLFISERVLRMVALDDFNRGSQRVGFVKRGVSDRDGEIGHGETVDQIAEINQPDDALVFRTEIIAAADDHIVIVRVVVNRALAKPRQDRLDIAFKLVREVDYESPHFVVLDQRPVFTNHAQAVGQIPVEIAVNGGMIKTGERAIKLADAPSEIAQ